MKLDWITLAFIYLHFYLGFGKTLTSIFFKKDLIIDRLLGRCPGYENLPLYFENIRFSPMANNFSISAKLVATRDVLSEMKLVLQLERCKAKEDLDSCEPYPDVNRNNLCELKRAKKQPWSPFINMVQPELPCPIKKGTYSLTNSSFDPSPLNALPIVGWYWKLKAIVYEVDRPNPVLCVYISGQVK